MSEANGAAHLLGAKPRITTGFQALVRKLDAQGTMQAAGVRVGPDGAATAYVERGQYMDGDDLLAAIRAVVREELAAALGRSAAPYTALSAAEMRRSAEALEAMARERFPDELAAIEAHHALMRQHYPEYAALFDTPDESATAG